MPTASTKQRDRKKAQKSGESSDARPFLAREAPEAAAAPETVDASPVSERLWLWGSVLVLFVAALLRLVALELKPLHHDEGVNAFFLTDLLEKGIYHYNPENYHGPTIYYFALPFVHWFGLTTTALRLVPALFGIATVWLVLCLRRYIGTVGALAAAALLAVSPGAVYYSRYFIHESLFGFFTLGIVVAAIRYYETAQARYLLLATASAALLFATKETAFISAGVLALATLLAWWYVRFARSMRWAEVESVNDGARQAKTATRANRAAKRTAKAEGSRFGDPPRLLLLALGATALFLFINVLFYSSFFTYGEGVKGALGTFKLWSQRTSAEHYKPFATYLKWLLKEEAPILVLATIGAAYAVLKPVKNRFAIFAGAWGFGLLLAYSLIGYKTPWLMLNFLIPLAIAGGYAVSVSDLWAERVKETRIPALLLAGAALAVCLYQTVQLNFYHYDDEAYPYVYVHTRREALDLVAEIDRLAALAGTGKQTTIAIASPDYWPLPWYLREYKHVGFHGRVGPYTDQIVIGKEGLEESLLSTALGFNYQRVGTAYTLRPGVNLVLYVRRDLAEQSGLRPRGKIWSQLAQASEPLSKRKTGLLRGYVNRFTVSNKLIRVEI